MNLRLSFFVVCVSVILFSLVLVLAAACSEKGSKSGEGEGTGLSSKQEALLKEASGLVESASKVEESDPVEASTKYGQALETVDELLKKDISKVLTGKLARGEIKLGPYTLDELKKKIYPMIKARAEAGESPLGSAALIAGEMKNKKRQAELLQWIAFDYIEVGQFDRALFVVECIPDNYGDLKVGAWAEIAAGFIASGQLDRAAETEKVISAESSSSITAIGKARNKALGKVASSYLGAGNPEQALETAKDMPSGSIEKALVFEDAAYAYAKMGEHEKAQSLFSDSLESAKDANKYSTSLNKQNVEPLWKRAFDFATVLPGDKFTDVLTRAQSVAHQTEKQQLEVIMLGADGRYEEAIGAAAELKYSGEGKMIAALARLAFDRGDGKQAKILLDEAVKAAMKLYGDQQRSPILLDDG